MPRDATQAEIKAAFRALSKETHPDVAGASNKARFQRIAHAASVLGHAQHRQAYDQQQHNLFSTAYGVAQPHGHSAFHRSNRPPHHNNNNNNPKQAALPVFY